jgi:DNA-binding XRE family transcriptional regulator
MPFTITCGYCKNPFSSKSSTRKYCSTTCAGIFNNNTKPFEEIFWSQVDVSGGPDACWPWAGGRNKNNYGTLKRKGKNYLAHRIAYTLTYGAIPEDKPHICHACDNPPCVNPRHLWAGTNLDNVKDKIKKGRGAKTYSNNGENHWKTKLTATLVREMRDLYNKGNLNAPAIAKIYGINRTTCYNIVTGQKWRI